MTPEQQRAIAKAKARMRKAEAERQGVTASGVYDAAKTIAANTAVETLAGVGGVGEMMFAGPQAGGQYVNNFRDYYSVKPSPEGARALEPAAKVLAPVARLFDSAGQSMGNAGASAARMLMDERIPAIFPAQQALQVGKQLLGQDRMEAAGYAAGRMAPDAALLAIGGGAAKRPIQQIARQSGQLAEDAAKMGETIKASDEAMRLKMKSPDADLAGKKLEPNKDPNLPSTVVKDPVGEEVVRQGFKPGVIQAIKVASKSDRAAMRKMIDIYERGQKDTRFAALNRPADAAGESIMKRIDLVKKVKEKAGFDIDHAALSLKGKTVDYSGAIDDFLNNLKKMGVTITDNGVALTKGSDIEGLASIEGHLNRVVRRMWDTQAPDAYDVHRLKRYLDENVGYGSKGAEGLSGKTETILKKLRRDLNWKLKQFPEYADANMRYSDTKELLDDLQSLAGKDSQLSGESGNRAMGRTVRKVFSNMQSRDRLIATLDDLNRVATKYGGKYDDDVVTQALFVQELERRFGSAASSSFQGDIEKAVGRVASGGVTSAAIRYATDKAVEWVKKERGVTDENALKAIRNLLKDP